MAATTSGTGETIAVEKANEETMSSQVEENEDIDKVAAILAEEKALGPQGVEGQAEPVEASPREGSPSSESEDSKVEKFPKEAEKKKSEPKSGKSKKREDKSIDHVLKALSSLGTPEEKLAALCKKYTDMYDENRILQSTLKQTQRKLTVGMREKDQLQSEHSKAVLAKSKLESLCRELQRHNKLIKEESLARAKEEEEKRKEVTTRFQTTINEIQTQMQENQARNNTLKEENSELANKLKGLIDQYEKREEHIEKIFKHKDLECQLSDAKLQQQTLQTAEEKERTLTEKKLLLTQLTEAHKKIELLEQAESHLKAQLALYTEKYEDFQSTLTKSNAVFGSFKTEMDKMGKKIKKLEKETTMWKTRSENSNKALLDMAEEKTRSDKELAMLQQKIGRLEKLCRALQAERRGGPSVTVTESEESSNYTLDTTEHDIQPTKTPPNTPSTPQSRASPTNVETGTSNNNNTLMVNGHLDNNIQGMEAGGENKEAATPPDQQTDLVQSESMEQATNSADSSVIQSAAETQTSGSSNTSGQVLSTEQSVAADI
ncbi:alpha-taxilin [Lingula anatina]|uniref:Alpha-taxilin n=1 Tax=Lingula anatina TaxID=7574 RepID=A0A1S3JXI0_LINAN|nr:alpha-taxilin [Lingula anatina]|eukprot:XP_013414749.1 alpha-taxilin [Lingula anatina]